MTAFNHTAARSIAAACAAALCLMGPSFAEAASCTDAAFDSFDPEDDFDIYSTAPDDGSSVNPASGTLFDGMPECEVIAVADAQAGTGTGGGPGAADSAAFVNWGEAFETTGVENDWVFMAKYQVAGGVEQEDGSIADAFGGDYFDDIVISGALLGGSTSDGQSGYFKIEESARLVYDELLILLKAKEYFYMALITDIPGLPEYVYYETPFRNNKGAAQDISHISFYGRIGVSSVADVPVPAAAPMLLAGLGGLALLRRRRKG